MGHTLSPMLLHKTSRSGSWSLKLFIANRYETNRLGPKQISRGQAGMFAKIGYGFRSLFGVEGLKVQTEVESSRVWCEVWARLVSDL